jgi:hypothetical protein
MWHQAKLRDGRAKPAWSAKLEESLEVFNMSMETSIAGVNAGIKAVLETSEDIQGAIFFRYTDIMRQKGQTFL